MNTLQEKMNTLEVQTNEKEEITEMAEMLSKIQRLPAERRIALQYYIKGTLNGIQMETERGSIPAAGAV